jgi:hypothetical protein
VVAITANDNQRRPELAGTWLVLLGGHRIAWGGLVGMWALILFFQFTAPETAKLAVTAAELTWKEVLLALQIEPQVVRRPRPTESPERTPQIQPLLPPRSDRRESPQIYIVENV